MIKQSCKHLTAFPLDFRYTRYPSSGLWNVNHGFLMAETKQLYDCTLFMYCNIHYRKTGKFVSLKFHYVMVEAWPQKHYLQDYFIPCTYSPLSHAVITSMKLHSTNNVGNRLQQWSRWHYWNTVESPISHLCCPFNAQCLFINFR